MTSRYNGRRRFLALSAFLLVPLSAFPQITLTGAIQFSAYSNGAFYHDYWNTVGGDNAWDLWLALRPDATLAVNGPTDAEAGISIALSAGNTYKYYIFATRDTPFSFDGLNLFFDGNSSTPGISVFGPVNSANFAPNNSSTLTLGYTPVPGSGTSFYSSAGIIAVVTGYSFNSPATPPGDVCQPTSFTPGGGPDLYGYVTLQVLFAAALTVSQSNGPPGASVTVTGSGFDAGEAVIIYAGRLGSAPISAVVADETGSFTGTVREPKNPYGPNDFFALGRTSRRLGASTFFVEPMLAASPAAGEPGSTISIEGVGFGAGETVSIYWNNPRTLIGTTVVDSSGSFVGATALETTIPSNATAGLNIVVGIGQTTDAFGLGEVEVQ